MTKNPAGPMRESAYSHIEKDFSRNLNKVILVEMLDATIKGSSEVLHFDPPLRCKVVRTEGKFLYRTDHDGEWVDPIYNVEVLEMDRVPEGFDSAWVYGEFSYNEVNGKVNPNDDWWRE
jgi:hypothetical protein